MPPRKSTPMSDPRKGRPSMSRLGRLSDCPGSLHAEQPLPEPPSSTDATSGTRCHAAWEKADDTGLSADERMGVTIVRELEQRALDDWFRGMQ